MTAGPSATGSQAPDCADDAAGERLSMGSALPVLRCASFVLFTVVMVALWCEVTRGLATAALAASAFGIFLFVCWTYGAFSSDVRPEQDPDPCYSRLDRLDGLDSRTPHREP